MNTQVGPYYVLDTANQEVRRTDPEVVAEVRISAEESVGLLVDLQASFAGWKVERWIRRQGMYAYTFTCVSTSVKTFPAENLRLALLLQYAEERKTLEGAEILTVDSRVVVL